jgi:hypothetical protein
MSQAEEKNNPYLVHLAIQKLVLFAQTLTQALLQFIGLNDGMLTGPIVSCWTAR